MANNLTLHIVNVLPWSNLNRDDTGTPKHLTQGGVQRGQLSSQSIKRAARIDYEDQALGITSVRSGNLVELVLEAAERLSPRIDRDKCEVLARKLIGALVKSEKEAGKKDAADKKDVTEIKDTSSKKDEKKTSAWLSSEEIEAAAALVVENREGAFLEEGRTGSLSIAAFGRMFANAPGMGTEAALAVSPAISTHKAVIQTDYFTTVDDAPDSSQGAGATFLGVTQYINGVFYRTVTIDRAQLHKSWTGMGSENARQNLEALITALIYKLPRGKAKGTAPYVMPVLVLCEEQEYRIAYDFETPVKADDAEGGYVSPTIDHLHKQWEAARRFDPDNFGPTQAIAGTAEGLDAFAVPQMNRQELVTAVVDWILP